MFDLKIKTKYNEPVELTIGPGDRIRFERKYNVGVTQFTGETLRFEWMAFLGWTALTRMDVTKLDFDSWIDTLEELEPTGNDDSGNEE